MAYEVPFDIIEVIMNNLASESDWESIRALSQTCQNLVEPCQELLFTTVAIHRSTMMHLVSLLAKRPKLANYVLHLHYYMDQKSDLDTNVSLLRRFSHLRSLHVTGDETAGGTAWNVIPQDLQNELIRMLTSPKLHTLSLTQIHAWPVSLFANCPHLQQLEIGGLGLHDSTMIACASAPFPPPCRPQKLSIGASAFYAVDSLLTARWPDGTPIVDLSRISVLHDHSVHAPIEELTNICKNHIEVYYFAYLGRFRELTNTNDFKALRVVIGNARWTDIPQPPNRLPSVEEIYLMVQPAHAKPITIEHVIAWLTPALFPALRTFDIFQEYGVNSRVELQLPFVNGPAIFRTRKVHDSEEFGQLTAAVNGLFTFL